MEGSTIHILTKNVEEKLMRIDSEMNMIKTYLRKIREAEKVTEKVKEMSNYLCSKCGHFELIQDYATHCPLCGKELEEK